MIVMMIIGSKSYLFQNIDFIRILAIMGWASCWSVDLI